MAEPFKNLTQLGHAIVRKTRLSNAMGVPLVFVIFISLGLFIAYCITRDTLLILLLFIVIAFFMFAFIYLMVKMPHLLRTEEHEEKMYAMSVGLGQKGKEISEDKLQSLPESAATEPTVIPQKNIQSIGKGIENE